MSVESLDHEGLPEVLREAGVTRAQAQAPEFVGLTWLRGECERLERMLRKQYRAQARGERPEGDDIDPRGDELADEDEEALRERPLLDPDVAEDHPRLATTLALRRWAYLKHLWISRSQNLERVEVDEHRRELMMKLTRREPVEVSLAGRTVEVTDRSYAALYEIARHATKLADLEYDLERLQELTEEVRGKIQKRAEAGEDWNHLRRRLHYLGLLYRGALRETRQHRRMIYAHVATEDGAPADGLEDAPEWWDEVSPLDDIRLLEAVREAGARRIEALGPAPDRPDQEDLEIRRLEDYGWVTTFRDWDREQPLPDPDESWIDRPLGQRIASVRAGARPVIEHTGRS